MGTVGECIYCGQTVELAEDGAWQTVDAGACGCMASLEQGGDGEHEAVDAAEAAEGRYFAGVEAVAEIDSDAEHYYEQMGGDA